MDERNTAKTIAEKDRAHIKSRNQKTKKNSKPSVDERVILYSYIQPDNMVFLKKISKANYISVSQAIDDVVTCFRQGKNIVISQRTPSYVKRAETWKKEREL